MLKNYYQNIFLEFFYNISNYLLGQFYNNLLCINLDYQDNIIIYQYDSKSHER